jgi:hypothetical protein
MLLTSDCDPAALWRYAERYLGGGTRTYSRYADELDIDDRFHPQRGVPSFSLPTFWIDPDHGSYLAGGTPSTLHQYYRHGESFLLPVHPETLTLAGARRCLAGCRPGPPIEVAPSANARTMFVLAIDGQPVPAHFVKLHYPKRLSRFTRRLRRPVIALQLWVADELMRIQAPVLPEVGGGVVYDGADPDQAWGFLLREAHPAGADPGYTLPWFALYGTDVHHPEHPTVLEQLVTASGQSPHQWLVDRLVTPVVTLWVQVLLRTGCAIEPHGQNTLLRLTPDLRTSMIAYRDCAVYVDPQLRAAAGLPPDLPPRNVIGQDVTVPAPQVFSLVYDSFLGHHTLTYLAQLAQRRWGLDPAVLHHAAQQVFAEQMDAGGVDKLLPPTVHYYTDQLPVDGRWQLADTGQLPQWR